MRRQRYNHTLSTQEDNLPQGTDAEDDPPLYEPYYVQPPMTFPLQTDGILWTNCSNYDISGRFYGMDQNRSFSTLASSTNSFYRVNNSLSSVGEPFQDAYGSQSFVQPSASSVDDVSGATGDSPDYGRSQQNFEGIDGQQAEQEVQYEPREVQALVPSIPNPTYPAMSTIGTVFLVLRHCIRVDITSDKAIIVTNYPGSCIGVMNDSGDQSCIIHPNGKIFQESTTVHIETGNKLAKFCRRGVVFTSREHSLSYVVDASGTKSTSEKFKDLSQACAMNVFFGSNPTHLLEQQSLAACHNMISEASYRVYNNGDEIWIIGGIRIKQNPWGELRISVNYNRRMLRTSPTINSISIATPFVFMKISCHPFRHFLVRRGERVFCAGASGVAIQNGSQKAGFDRVGRLVLL